jgi:hypothetical protein
MGLQMLEYRLIEVVRYSFFHMRGFGRCRQTASLVSGMTK